MTQARKQSSHRCSVLEDFAGCAAYIHPSKSSHIQPFALPFLDAGRGSTIIGDRVTAHGCQVLPSAGQVSGKEVCDRSTFEESRISRWVQVPSLIWLSAISQCARGQTTPLELRLERSAALVTTCALGCHSRHVIIFRAKTCRTGQPPSQWMHCRGWTAMQVNLCLEARETCSHGSLCLTKA